MQFDPAQAMIQRRSIFFVVSGFGLRNGLPGRCDLPQYQADLLPVIRLEVAQESSHAALGKGRQLMKADS